MFRFHWIATPLILSGLLAMPLLSSWADPPKAPPKETTTDKNSVEVSPEERERQLLTHFMRRKLEASSMVLEGLAVEDYSLIREGGERLYKMSTVEKWRQSNDALYKQYSGEFQRVTQDLIKAAESKSLDRSALKWMDVTLKCIECHRYVREMLVVDGDPDADEMFKVAHNRAH